MKKLTLSALFGLVATIMVLSCSTESTDTDHENTNDIFTVVAKPGSYWEGVIATGDGGTNYTFVADTTQIIADFQEAIDNDSIKATLQDVFIVKKTASNDASNEGYVLISTDQQGVSIGVMLMFDGVNYKLSREEPVVNATSCSGCNYGCNLSYLLVDGHKYLYCNENGCGVLCVKRQSDFYYFTQAPE